MSDSVIAKKEFLAALKPLICCYESGGLYCRANDFCSSDPNVWPGAGDTNETRLAHQGKDAVPGTSEFCDHYLDWHKKYFKFPAGIPRSLQPLYFSSEQAMVRFEKMSKIVKDVPPSLQTGEGAIGTQRFLDDAQLLVSFCTDVKKTEAEKNKYSLQRNEGKVFSEKPSGDSNALHWIVSIAAGIGAGVAVTYLIKLSHVIGRAIKGLFKNVPDKPAQPAVDVSGEPSVDLPLVPSVDALIRDLGDGRAPPQVATSDAVPVEGSVEQSIRSLVRGITGGIIGEPVGPQITAPADVKDDASAGEVEELSSDELIMEPSETPDTASAGEAAATPPEPPTEPPVVALARKVVATSPEPPPEPPVAASAGEAVVTPAGPEGEGVVSVPIGEMITVRVETPTGPAKKEPPEPPVAASVGVAGEIPLDRLRIEIPLETLMRELGNAPRTPPVATPSEKAVNATVETPAKPQITVPAEPPIAASVEVAVAAPDETTVAADQPASGEIKVPEDSSPASAPGQILDPSEIILPELQRQQHPLDLMFAPPDGDNFIQTSDGLKVPAYPWRSEFGQPHEDLDQLRKIWEALKKQPLYVQFFIENLAKEQWAEESKKGKKYGDFITEFVGGYLQHDLTVYGASALKWMQEKVEAKWSGLLFFVKEEFGHKQLWEPPPELLDAFKRVPGDLVMDPLSLLVRSDTPWKSERDKHRFYRGVNLDAVMETLIGELTALLHYPNLLGLEARLLIDSWMRLDPKKQELIREMNLVHEFDSEYRMRDDGVPLVYVRMWHNYLKLTDARVNKDGGGTNSPAGGAVTGFVPSGETHGAPDTGSQVMPSAAIYNNTNVLGVGAIMGLEVFSGFACTPLFLPPPPVLSYVHF